MANVNRIAKLLNDSSLKQFFIIDSIEVITLLRKHN